MKNRAPLLVVKPKLQGHLLWLVFVAMALPTVFFGGALWLLVYCFGGLSPQMGPDESRVRVLQLVLILFPVWATGLFCWAFHLTNRVVGPVERMIRELDARLGGTASGPIVLRPKDLLRPLAEKINRVVAEWEKSRPTPPAPPAS